MSAVIEARRSCESGGAVEVVLASVALAIAVVALVVALTLEPHAATTKYALGPFLSGVHAPDVVGMTTHNAQVELSSVGLVFGVALRPSAGVPAGVVLRQTPIAGLAVAPGTTVSLVVSSGHA